MFENYKVFEYTLAGRPLVIETGKQAGLANGLLPGPVRRYRCSGLRDRVRKTARRHRLSAAVGRF